ncbi:Myoferlin [Pteropus alecto]|uniref:Myoferlin n=1 Tax=Pteropus alecto TaxID=9402 RepID=L5JND3_PTEAL|nr:Myoferlin [Pteropus alecto]
MLRVIVESASNIPKTKFGKPDPIVSVIFKDEKKKTKKVDNELNPVWNEILEFDLRGVPLDFSSSLGIVVKDFETIGQNKLIGTATVSLKELIGDQSRSLPYKLISLLNERGQETGATIDLMIGYDPPSTPHPNDLSGTSMSGVGVIQGHQVLLRVGMGLGAQGRPLGYEWMEVHNNQALHSAEFDLS